MTKLFETSLFGYSKRSVHSYIEQMNEEFSQKLLLRNQTEKEDIRKLEEEVERLRQENEQLRSMQMEVAGALIEAKTHATSLIAQAEKEDLVMREENRARRAKELQRIQTLIGDVNSLQEAFCKILRHMEEELTIYRLRGEAMENNLEAEIDRPISLVKEAEAAGI